MNIQEKNQQVIEGFRTGETETLINAYTQIMPQLTKYVLSNTGSIEEAKELAWESLEKFRQKCLHFEDFELIDKKTGKHFKFGKYMYGIYRFTWLDKLRARKKRNYEILVPGTRNENEESGLSLENLEESSFELINEFKELKNMVLDEINQLSAICKQIFKLNCFEEKSHKEIGEMLDVKEGTSRKRLKDCRTNLIDRISKNPVFQSFDDISFIQKYLLEGAK